MLGILFVLCSTHFAHSTIYVQPRFTDGNFAEYGEHPYTVAVYEKQTEFAVCSASTLGTNRSLLCTGVIMSSHWVLSVGSCYKNKDRKLLEIEAGILILHASQTLRQCSRVVEIIFHPSISYKHEGDPRKSTADMGLLRVKKRLVLTDFIREPYFPTAQVPTDGVISGWGLNDDDPRNDENAQVSLQYASLNIVPNHKCSEFYRKNFGINVQMWGENICAMPSNSESTFCQTDRGAPLISDSYLIGIFSMAIGDCTPNGNREPAIFTKISNHFSFIKQHVHDLDEFTKDRC